MSILTYQIEYEYNEFNEFVACFMFWSKLLLIFLKQIVKNSFGIHL